MCLFLFRLCVLLRNKIYMRFAEINKKCNPGTSVWLYAIVKEQQFHNGIPFLQKNTILSLKTNELPYMTIHSPLRTNELSIITIHLRLLKMHLSNNVSY